MKAILSLVLSAGVTVFAAQPVPPPSGNADYPRVDVTPAYEVDPKWPQRPAGMPWGDVPGIAVDRQDQVWVFTRTNPPVQVFTAEGRFVRAWGEGVVSNAHHLKIDREGNVWLSDVGFHVVRKCTPEGKVLLTIGTPGKAGEAPNLLSKPTDMAIAPNGDVFISDGYGNSRVAHFDRTGKFIRAWGTLGTGREHFSLPHAVVLDSRGRVYVADRNNVRVQVFNQRGRLLDSWHDVVVPWGFWMTDRDEIWVCGSSPMTWRFDPKYPTAPLGCPPKDQLFARFNTEGKLVQLWTVPKAEDGKERPGELNWVHCLAIDSRGNIYAGDIIGKRAQKFVRVLATKK
jgi:DNA-binding beta-propeller fold protein YncE